MAFSASRHKCKGGPQCYRKTSCFDFAATVGHLCHAVRKLAAVATPEEVQRQLFRGVQGVLPAGFFYSDNLGMLCATDAAFMSTSVIEDTAIHYMGEVEAVLWHLIPGGETDSVSHYERPAGSSIEQPVGCREYL